jgi:imidazolonepropionase-like amidohydrolase
MKDQDRRDVLIGGGAVAIGMRMPTGVQFSTGLALALAATVLSAQPRQDAASHALALTHVNVIDATGAPLQRDATVIIAGERIAAIGPSASTPVPAQVQVVDAKGKFLIPALWDMHVHLNHKEYLPLFIANGVTGVRVMWGDPQHARWRSEIEAGTLTGPRMMIGSPLVDGPNPYWPGSISVSTEAQARGVMGVSKQRGADFVKTYQFLPRDLYFDIADEAKKDGIPFEGHVPVTVTAEEASRAGQKSFEHLIGVLPAISTHSDELLQAAQAKFADTLKTRGKFEELHDSAMGEAMLDSLSPEKAAALFAVFKANGTWQCPTLTLLHMFGYGDDPAVLNDPRARYMPPRTRERWKPTAMDGGRAAADFAFGKKEFARDLEVVGAMQKAGVGILAGTDTQNPYTFYGFSLHDELGFLVQAGLTPMQALQAATLNAARFFGKEADRGTIEMGKLADLVLLDANPLEDIANTRRISAVVFGGMLYPRPALDALLAQVEALAARPLIGDVLQQTIEMQGIDAAVNQYHELRDKQPDGYDFSENELIVLGNALIRGNRYVEAIEIFKLAVVTYPQSYNAFDSLAEAYMDHGDKELAIRNYKKSLELNPGSANGKKMLEKLNAQ